MDRIRRTPWLLIGLVGLTAILTGCDKLKNKSASTSSGGGTSTQSVMTLKGASS